MPQITTTAQQPWRPHPEREARLSSAIAIATWATETRFLYPAHRKELLKIAVWKATELDGKWRTRHRTERVFNGPRHLGMQHEHVLGRSWLADQMSGHPDLVEPLLRLTVGCLVTPAEHKALPNGTEVGWFRYVSSEVAVIDTATGRETDLRSTAAHQAESLAELGIDP